MRPTQNRHGCLVFGSVHLLNCSPSHLLYFFAFGRKNRGDKI